MARFASLYVVTSFCGMISRQFHLSVQVAIIYLPLHKNIPLCILLRFQK
uniref:Uncharacterized protein n=1 Tax=Schistosoma curassoni TaxID=6186 RepID=A0A183JNZ2_9TREM